MPSNSLLKRFGVAAALWGFAMSVQSAQLTFCCRPDNDLYKALTSGGRRYPRTATPDEAVAKAPEGSAVLILADDYPAKPVRLTQDLLDHAAAKKLKIYAEYALLPGRAAPEPRKAGWERVVVAGTGFGNELPAMRILTIHAASFLPVEAANPILVMARVAGFDKAVFGLPKQSWPILFESGSVMVSTTKLSQFVTARYAPSAAWQHVWEHILSWLGAEGLRVTWKPAVRPTHGREDPLPADAERHAAQRALKWFSNARLLIAPTWRNEYDLAGKWPDRTVPPSPEERAVGDGSLGVMEGFSSRIDEQGRQPTRWWIRADCNGEAAMAFALGNPQQRKVGQNLGDFLMFHSIQTQGERNNPAFSSFGLIGWNDVCRYWGDLDGYKVFYGDDNARAMLGIMGAAGALQTDRWDAMLLRSLLANLRTTGRLGYRLDRLEQDEVEKNGWRFYWNREVVNEAPHFEAYLWACDLWAYARTGFRPFLTRARAGIEHSMTVSEAKWRWGGGTIERARMLLPLAWLVRVDDTPQHRKWLAAMADKLIAAQDASGGIREEFGTLTDGGFGAPQSNEAYGTGETPIIQQNGDPLADMLYSCNFAFIGFHEAAAATGEKRYADAADKLAKFLCRIQIRSATHPEFDGAWFRAFDMRNWDYWASNADAGWGAWSIESGWSVTWIATVFALRERHTSLWELTAGSMIGKHLAELRPLMVPDDAIQTRTPDPRP